MSEPQDVVKARFKHAKTRQTAANRWIVTSGKMFGISEIGYGDSEEAAWVDAESRLSRHWYPGGVPTPVILMAGAGVILMVLTLGFAWIAWRAKPAHEMLPGLYLLAVIWAILPALCFWHEYHSYLVYKLNDSQFERYKYGVQLGSAIWAAIVISLLAYASNDHFKPPEEPKPFAGVFIGTFR